MHPLKTTDSTAIAAKLGELYVTTRFKYLMQTDSGYIALNSNQKSHVQPLHDGFLAAHVEGKYTYGVFDRNGKTKFLTFDVDYPQESEARWATLKLIDVLCEDFGISREDIHVSLSGSKGFHVDLFFADVIETAQARQFHAKVMQAFGNRGSGDVEFRPTFTQGVKLPLGIHRKTGNRCHFCNVYTLEPIENPAYILGIEPMAAEIVLDALIELSAEQEEEFARVVSRTDTSLNAVDASRAREKAAAILDAGRLTHSNTRHNATFTLAVFFHSQGYEQADAVEAIMDILLNTPREYFSADSLPDFWEKEATRLTAYVFEKEITLGNVDKTVTVFKSEILAVLNVGTFRQKQLAYAMLITSKRYGRVFYLPQTVAMKMLGTNARQTVVNATKKLVECGFIEYVRRNEIDVAASREAGQVRKKPNKYRLMIAKPEKGEKSVEAHGKDDMIDVTKALVTESERRDIIPRWEREKRWS